MEYGMDPSPQATGNKAEPRIVTAITRFRGGPGRERDAALAWGFELMYYFLRAPGEAPQLVIYDDGVYTCTGQMMSTHPREPDPADFTRQDPWDLDYCLDPQRQAALRRLHAAYPRWDGTAREENGPAQLLIAAARASLDPSPAVRIAHRRAWGNS